MIYAQFKTVLLSFFPQNRSPFLKKQNFCDSNPFLSLLPLLFFFFTAFSQLCEGKKLSIASPELEIYPNSQIPKNFQKSSQNPTIGLPFHLKKKSENIFISTSEISGQYSQKSSQNQKLLNSQKRQNSQKLKKNSFEDSRNFGDSQNSQTSQTSQNSQNSQNPERKELLDKSELLPSPPPPPPWGPEGINDPDDFLKTAVLQDSDPETDQYREESLKWSSTDDCYSVKKQNNNKVFTREPEGVYEEVNKVHVKFYGKFSYELLGAVPYAYFHFLNGSLGSTTSCGVKSVSLFYFFSENHVHDFDCESNKDKIDNVSFFGWNDKLEEERMKVPREFFPPPLASFFREKGKVWDDVPAGAKLVVVSNKLGSQLNLGPNNFLDINLLKAVLHKFLDNGYYVVYNRPGMANSEDEWEAVRNKLLHMDDFKVVRKLYLKKAYAGRIRLMQDIHFKNPDISFNEVQLRMMARSKCFVSVEGGNSILSSYFGGINLIFARKSSSKDFEAFHKSYSRLSDVKILVGRSHYFVRKGVRRIIESDDCRAV